MTERQKRFTPGPWGSHSVTAITGGHHIGSESGLLAVTVKGEAQARYVDDANAHLISAAPDLLETLEEAVACWGDYVPHRSSNAFKALEKARAAIAKAYGESQ